MLNKILFITFLLITTEAFAFQFTEEICRKYNLGSSWYCEKEQSEDQDISPQQIMNMDIMPEQKAEMLNQLWEVQRKRAVITGKKDDLEKLLITQRFIAEKGTDFARKMVRLVETHPEYSNSESYYKNVSDQYLEKAEKERLFSEAKNTYSLAFVYSSSCPYCKRQLPIILSFKEQTGIEIIGVSVDGGFYDGFDASVYDENAASDPNVQAYPTILLIDNKNPQRIFVAKGLTTRDDLENRIYRILKENEHEKSLS